MRKILKKLSIGLMLILYGCDGYVATETSLWQNYKNTTVPYKVYMYIDNWQSQGYDYGNFWYSSYQSLDDALKRAHISQWCKRGCKVLYVGNSEISREEQKTYGKRYLPPTMFAKIFNNQDINKSKPKKQKPKKSPDDNKIVAAASGSGFFITSSGYAITNNHVIEGCRKVSLSHNGQNIAANIIATDPKNDLAILKSNVRPLAFYKISPTDVKLLDDVIIAGYPLGKRVSSAIKTSKGSVTALAGYGDNYSNFQTDAALNQGNSGGPIIDNTGNVVGVAVANYGKQAGVESFNFGIKSTTLKTFMSSNNVNFQSGSKSTLSNKALGNLITNGTIYIECWLTVADIKKIMTEEANRKAIYSEYQ